MLYKRILIHELVEQRLFEQIRSVDMWPGLSDREKWWKVAQLTIILNTEQSLKYNLRSLNDGRCAIANNSS